MTTNQTSMIGPNMPPSQEVPLRWTMNKKTRIATVSGTTSAVHLRGVDLDAFDCAEHGNGRRYGAVAVKQGRPEQTDDDQDCAPPALLGATWTDQGEQRQDAALAMIVGAHDQNCIFDGNDDDQRPEDQ